MITDLQARRAGATRAASVLDVLAARVAPALLFSCLYNAMCHRMKSILVTTDHRTKCLLGQNLQQQRMWNTAVDDVDCVDT